MKTIEATLVVADTPNKNNRVYPMSTCMKLVDKGNKSSGWFGTMTRQVTRPGAKRDPSELFVDMENVSHHVSNFRMEGKELKATVRVLDTPPGHVLLRMIDAEIDMAFRLYGRVDLSPCKENRNHIIVDHCDVIEIVAMPLERAA